MRRPQALCMYAGYAVEVKARRRGGRGGDDDEEGVSGGMDHGVRGERVRDAVRDGQGEDANQREYGEARAFGGVRREIVAREGARGLYAGFWPTCLRNNVFNACYFGSIHWCKGFMSTPETFVEQAGQNIGVGAVAGLVATALKMPFDILKSRMQGQVPSASGAVEYPTMTSAAIKILRMEGPSAFYKGTAGRRESRSFSD